VRKIARSTRETGREPKNAKRPKIKTGEKSGAKP